MIAITSSHYYYHHYLYYYSIHHYSSSDALLLLSTHGNDGPILQSAPAPVISPGSSDDTIPLPTPYPLGSHSHLLLLEGECW